MYSTLEECRRAWEEAGKHGGIPERIERNERWIRYYRTVAAQQEDSGAAFDPHAEEVADHLLQTGWLRKDSTVLDIGAGTGAYSLSLAKRCAGVTALDMDGASLAVLAEYAAALNLRGVRTEKHMWEEYATAGRFSVTFSSLCPAICTYEELLRMEAMTEDACCLIAVTRGSYDLHRRELMRLLSVTPAGGMTTEALWYYEMLYLMGRQPNVRTWTQHVEYDLPLEEALRRGEIYFQIFGIPAEDSRPVLRRYYESKASGGLVHDVTHLNTALLCWSPH